mmetsp:Transcript_27284/g.84132  ORF Transcript_27284/g.84132 Transcript_27284/m.84132 type:complete len:317 (-) Transcript_27284:449-1399(-)
MLIPCYPAYMIIKLSYAFRSLRINFNVTMLDLQCEYATVDIVDALGTNSMNVTKNVEKWQLDAAGRRMIFQGRNREQKAIHHEEHHQDINELHKNGIHAVEIDQASFDNFLSNHPYVFINFFAPWCIWCQRLEPTWETMAEELERINEEEMNLCGSQRIQAFPTLRFFKDAKQYGIDYKQDRTVTAMLEFLKQKVELEKTMEDWHPRRKQRMLEIREHPGCMVSGHVLVNRVPGNFHLSHVVNHLSFGTPLDTSMLRKISKYSQFQSISPLDGGVFMSDTFHQAHHHYSKVVSTYFEAISFFTPRLLGECSIRWAV